MPVIANASVAIDLDELLVVLRDRGIQYVATRIAYREM
jgi:hypothetical protein